MRAIALDVGERRIGVAVGDLETATAVPVGVVQRIDDTADCAAVLEYVKSREADAVVVGMPLSMNGDKGPQARRVAGFVKRLKSVTELPIITWDERLSTVEASRHLLEARGGRSSTPTRTTKVRQTILDATAATVILQSFLDAQRRN